MSVDELAKERYDLAVERIREIREEKTVAEPYLEFFTKTAGFLEEMIRLRDRVEAGEMKKLSLEELRRERIRSAIRIFCRKIIRPLIQVRIMRQRYWEKSWVYC